MGIQNKGRFTWPSKLYFSHLEQISNLGGLREMKVERIATDNIVSIDKSAKQPARVSRSSKEARDDAS